MRPVLVKGRVVLATSCVVCATSCGGGGSNNATPLPPPPPPSPPVTLYTDMSAGSGISFDIRYLDPLSVNDREIPLLAGGVAAGDYDEDGDVDLFVVRGDLRPNLLYRNFGNGVFEDVAATAGVAFTKSATENYFHSGPTFADMDGDNDLDLFIGGVIGDPSVIFANNGDGTFTNVTQGSGIDMMTARNTISAAFGDYDLDGDVDLFLAHWNTRRSFSNPGDTEHLWRNDSDASGIRFTSVSIAAGISPTILTLPDPNITRTDFDTTFAPVFARVNDDLFPDILSVADFNFSQVFINNGDGTFTNATDVDVIDDANGMGNAVGDYDSDGDLDWFVTSIFAPNENPNATGNRLYQNDNGVFTDVTDQAGVVDGGWGWAACFLDLENDGDLDIYHTNGWPETGYAGDFTSDTSRAFVSDGQGRFSDQASSLGLADMEQGRGVVCADFDGDSDTDIFLWHFDDSNGAMLFRNDGAGNNSMSIKLNGLPPNTEAAGARIKATIGSAVQMREITIGSNYVSQNPTTQLFGLGQAAQIDNLVVEWPDGRTSDLGVVSPSGQVVVIDHPDL